MMAGKTRIKLPRMPARSGANTGKSVTQAQFVRSVCNQRIDPRYVPMLLRDIATQTDALAESLNDSLQDPSATLRPSDKSRDAMTVEVTIQVNARPTVAKMPKQLRRKNRSES